MKQLIFFCWLISVTGVHAQTLTHYNYSVAEGLPSAESYDIFQDEKGFLWFATDNGIVKFDGKEMKTFHLKDGLTDPVVFEFQPDPEGRIWFRTFSGKLSYIEDDIIKPYIYNDTLQQFGIHGLVYPLYVSETDELWFTVRNLLGRIDAKGNVSVDTFETSNYHSTMLYRSIGSKGLIVNAVRYLPITSVEIDGKRFSINLPPSNFFNQVFGQVRWRNKLYLSLLNSVLEYDGRNLRVVYNAEKPIISISVDREGYFWVGYRSGGARRFSSPAFDTYLEPEFLRDQSVTKVFQSADDSYWFSTLETGIYYLANLAITNYWAPGDSQVKDVKTGSNYIAIGDKTGGVHFYDRKTKRLLRSKAFPYNILSLFVDSKDILWVSSHSHISVLDKNLNSKNQYDRAAYEFFEEPNGTMWALGSARLMRFGSDNSLQNIQRLDDLYRNLVVHDSSFFLSQRIGLHVRDRQLKLINAPPEFKNYKISKMMSLNDSTVLVATMGNGFHLLNTETLTKTTYNLETNFIANNIYCLLKQDSLLWIGTENGLAVTSVDALLKGKPEFNFLSRKSGLVSDMINFLALGENSVWAFSSDAFSVIPNSSTRFANKTPSFYLKSVNVNGEPSTLARIQKLSPDQDNIGIHFGFISFNNQNIFLRYKIRNENPWVNLNSNERNVQLSSLAPDEYRFHLQFSSDNINWSDAITPIPFLIDSPWWAKWYFYVSLTSIILILGYLYFRYQRSVYREKHHYLRIINEHQQKLLHSEIETLERERNRIAKELHDRVGTNLTAIKLRVNQILRTHNNPDSGDVEDQFQVAIKEIKEIIYDLTPPSLERYGLFTGLRNYVGKLDKRIPLNISLKTFGAELHHYDLNILIFRVLQELISNSIKHSFAKNITIHISAFDDLVNIVYEDDGIGFQYDPVKSGLGLNNIETRIQSVNGALKFESGTFGVSYTIDIPLKKQTDLKTTIKDLNHDSNGTGG